MPSGPPCQAFFSADAVFVGTVKNAQILKTGSDQLYERRLVQIAVDGPSKGTSSGVIEVWTGMGGGDCGFTFIVGQRYVVYANRRSDGTLSTGICSRTRRLSEGAEDVAYLQSGPALPIGGARISGRLLREERNATAQRVDRVPVSDVQIVVRGAAGAYTASTDAEGRYAIQGVRPGEYGIEAIPPSEFSDRYLTSKFEITDARACRVQDFFLRFNGRISGVLMDAGGMPARGARVELAPADTPDRPISGEPSRAVTDAGGRFELSAIQPGRYIIGVGVTPDVNETTAYPRTWYSDDAHNGRPVEIEIGKGNLVQLEPWRLPPALTRHDLKGTVVTADGTPAAGASVVLRIGFHQASEVVKTAADGSFTVPAFEGLIYQVHTYLNVPGEGFRQMQGSKTVTITGPPPPVQLVLRSGVR
jgi:hypothetical protein